MFYGGTIINIQVKHGDTFTARRYINSFTCYRVTNENKQ